MIRSWSRLLTSSRAASTASAIVDSAAARSEPASPAYRSGSNRFSNSSTSSREIAGFATRAAST